MISVIKWSMSSESHEFSFKIVRVITIIVSNLINFFVKCPSMTTRFAAILLLSPPSYILNTLVCTILVTIGCLLSAICLFQCAYLFEFVARHESNYKSCVQYQLVNIYCAQLRQFWPNMIDLPSSGKSMLHFLPYF